MVRQRNLGPLRDHGQTSRPVGSSVRRSWWARFLLPDRTRQSPRGAARAGFLSGLGLGLSMGLLLVAGCTSADSSRAQRRSPSPHDPGYHRIELTGLHNTFRVSDRILSGSQPEDPDAFAALAKLGVKTIVSVDGSQPDLKTARQFGLRYIHLPIGYDGIPSSRAIELAKAVSSQPTPVYVHCHHGLHRGPAAVAVICEATENWTPAQAQEWMRTAGTAPEYRGLYQSAATFQSPTARQLAAVKQLPESSPTSALVDVMVRVDEHLTHLKLCQKAGWKTPPGHPDITPAHEATLLWEELRELTRSSDTAARPRSYQDQLATSVAAADILRQALQPNTDPNRIEVAFAKISPSCTACHKDHRNPPRP